MFDLSFFSGRLEGARAGKDYILARCIFHDDHNPSMILYGRIGKFECFSCEESGTLDYLASRLRGVITNDVVFTSRSQTKRWVPRPSWNIPGMDDRIAGYCEEAHKRLKELTPTHSYLERRGLVSSMLWSGIGWDNGWYVIPIKSADQTIQGAVARASPDRQETSRMKFDMPYGQPPMLYVPRRDLWNEAERVFIVFGVFDAISMCVAGLGAASPSSGKLSLDTKWLDNVGKRICIVPDLGEEKQAFQYAAELDWRGQVIQLDYRDGEKDVNDILVHRGVEGVHDAMESVLRNRVRPDYEWEIGLS